MKKIRIWKIIVLSIITLGIYDIVWYIKRQEEMQNTYGLTMPHWLWMLLPSLVLGPVIVPIVFLVLFSGFTPLVLALVIFAVLLVIAVIAITIWWFLGFSRAAAKVTAERVPVGWAFALTILASPAEIIAYQYYINRYAGDTLPVKAVGPSKKFIRVAIIVIVVSVVLGALSNMIPVGTPPVSPEYIQSQQ